MTESLQIAQVGNPILRQQAHLVNNVREEHLQQLIDALLITASASNGVGIAAPQVSESYRLFIVASRPNARYPNAPLMEPTAMINPQIITHSTEIKSLLTLLTLLKVGKAVLASLAFEGWFPGFKRSKLSTRRGMVSCIGKN